MPPLRAHLGLFRLLEVLRHLPSLPLQGESQTVIPPLAIVGIVAASVFLAEYPAFRKTQPLVGLLEMSLMFGFIGVGVYALMLVPVPGAGVNLAFGYTPHAWEIIVWSVMCLTVIRQKFGPVMMLPAFITLYALQELIWNPFAIAEFWGQWATASQPLWYVVTLYWESFITVSFVAAIVGFLYLRPRVRLTPVFPLMLLFLSVWAFVFGLPAGGLTYWSLAWEIAWDAVYFSFIYFTFFRGKR